MLDLLFIPSAVLYLIVVGLLFIYGINFFYLTYITLRKGKQIQPIPEMTGWPCVTIQLPIYNELYVARRLIQAAANLDYPKHLLEIQVLDDSTDETVGIVDDLVEQLRKQGIDIHHLHRENRQGFKAGALAHGLEYASGEFLAIFDADFIPGPNFLVQTLPFFQDDKVGFVQARWGHANRDYSFLTFLQSLAIDAHFMVEQFARSQVGFWFNFNGTAGVWRKIAIQDAGGWTFETLTEDLDLSYRAFFHGWKAIYVRNLEVPAELPVSFSAYRRQQHRWARGSLECAIKFIPKVWGEAIPTIQKVEATLHLTGYTVHLLLCALVILYPLILILSVRYANLISLFGIAFLFNATAFAPTVFFMVAQQQLGHRWWRKLPMLLFIPALGAGMMLNTLRASLEIFSHKKATFERTPKYGIDQKKQNWTRQRYQLRLDPIVFFEIAFALFNLTTVFLAFHLHNWVIAVYSAIFCCGLLFTSGSTIFQTFVVWLAQSRTS
jgi:cellulose synthase/poly-beta-1,6-N-acetylglucosamine synthase-like glycosyltransferase